MSDAPLVSILYTSRNRIDPAAEDNEIKDIVAKARVKNLSSRITGALLFSGDKFAQILEGDPDAIEPLMMRIAEDPRHDDLRIMPEEPIGTRRFASWSMAYLGKFPAAETHIDAVHAGTWGDAPERLVGFMASGASGSLND